MLEFIIFRLRKGSLSSFLNLYLDFGKMESDKGQISLENLTEVLKSNGVEIHTEKVEEFWNFFRKGQ